MVNLKAYLEITEYLRWNIRFGIMVLSCWKWLSQFYICFINSVIRQFQDRSNQSNIDDFDDYIIPPNFLDITKSFIFIELPLCENNEKKSKTFLKNN